MLLSNVPFSRRCCQQSGPWRSHDGAGVAWAVQGNRAPILSVFEAIEKTYLQRPGWEIKIALRCYTIWPLYCWSERAAISLFMTSIVNQLGELESSGADAWHDRFDST